MAGVYTPEQKSFAKALVVATGNTETAIELLRGIWGSEAGDDFTMPSQIPSASSLRNWMHDPRIAVDEALIREWGDRARAKVLATSELIADEMAEALREARARYMAKDGTALDVLNLAKSFGIVADKLNGRYGNQPGVAPAGMVINGNVQVVAWERKEPARQVAIESGG